VTTAFFRVGFAAQLTLVVVLSAGAYAGVVPTQIPEVPHSDLAGHAVLIGLLAFFLDGALELRPLGRRAPWSRVRLAPLLVLAAAGTEEWAQRFSPRRHSSWSDFSADVVGVVLLSWLAARAVRGSRGGTGHRAQAS
jgi:hypothetical protein